MDFHETWMEDASLPRMDPILLFSVDQDKEMDPGILFSLSLALQDRALLQHVCSFLRLELDEKNRHI